MYYINCFMRSLKRAEDNLNNTHMPAEWRVRTAFADLFFAAMYAGDIEDPKEHDTAHDLLMWMYHRVDKVEDEEL